MLGRGVDSRCKVAIEGDKAKLTREVDGGLQTVELTMLAIVTTDPAP